MTPLKNLLGHASRDRDAAEEMRALLRRLGLDYDAEVCRVGDPRLELPIVAIERQTDR